MDSKDNSGWIIALVITILLISIAFAIWEVVAQIKYDGQFIEWRFIPLW